MNVKLKVLTTATTLFQILGYFLISLHTSPPRCLPIQLQGYVNFTLLKGIVCANETDYIPNGQNRSYFCPQPNVGRHVLIQQTVLSMFLTICEIEIYGNGELVFLSYLVIIIVAG